MGKLQTKLIETARNEGNTDESNSELTDGVRKRGEKH